MGKDLNLVKQVVFICNGGSCEKKGAEQNTYILREKIMEHGIHEQVHTIKTKCTGQCEHGPMVFIHPDGIWYKHTDAAVAKAIVTQHLVNNKPLASNILFAEGEYAENNSYTAKPINSAKSTLKKIGDLFRLIILLILMLNSSQIWCQVTTVKGKVADVYDQTPISGVTVSVQGSSKIVLTDADGNYALNDIEKGEQIITFKAPAFDSVIKHINIADGATVLILNGYLRRQIVELSEITIAATDNNNKSANTIELIAFKLQPVKSAQDLLRTVPGLFIAQHAGGGKAEQIMVRGIDNDHGTDFAITMDGLPINMPSHAHGQGYADMHFIIPETIGSASYYKGPYEASLGDFSVAGAALYNSKYSIDKSLIKLEYGQYNSQRALLMLNLLNNKPLLTKRDENLYLAADYTYTDSYFKSKQHFKRFNIFSRYNAQLSEKTSLNFTVSTFYSSWNASGQVPQRLIEQGLIDRFGSVNPTEGGLTSRTNINAIFYTTLNTESFIKNQLYYVRNNYCLFSDFTFFKEDSIHGDEIAQKENRNIIGYKSSYNRTDSLFGKLLKTEAGFSIRTDLLHTTRDFVYQREFLANVNNNEIAINNYSLFLNENYRLASRLLLNIGLRNDWFNVNLHDNTDGNNSGHKLVYRLNPKLNLYYEASNKITLFAKSGIGFHSNYAQVIVSKHTDENPIPQSYGFDLGSNMKLGNKLVISATIWSLTCSAESKFVNDIASFENIGAARRLGMDAILHYNITTLLWVDVALNYAHGRLLNAPAGENFIPIAPVITSTGGITYKNNNGISASMRYRYMGKRPVIEDNSKHDKGYFIADLVASYAKKRYEIGFCIENILNTKWSEAIFYDESQLKNESSPVMDFHITPGTPFLIKGNIAYFF